MSHKYAGVLLGVLINEEQWRTLHGAKQEGLIDKYAKSLHEEERYLKFGVPSTSQSTDTDYIGFFMFTAGQALVDHYVEKKLLPGDTFQVVELPDKDEVMDWRRGLHFAGLLKDTLEQWHHFAEFCAHHGLELPTPRLYVVVDKE